MRPGPGSRGTIHQAVAVTGMRRTRYRGLAKAATAVNLIRLDAWWNDTPPRPHENIPARGPQTRSMNELGNRVIETFYNRRRRRKHKTFGYLTPAETRQRHQHIPAA
ncbi:hypothetical protein [Streptomyces longisporoflavus]|uniref:Transposase n=1 Tax=Streptomyces longisporoflavus TaxID=28044 RepID=A0ABW7R367_9ACTN